MTSFSITLETSGEIDIGLLFDGYSNGSPLCIGMILASFKTSGNTPDCV